MYGRGRCLDALLGDGDGDGDVLCARDVVAAKADKTENHSQRRNSPDGKEWSLPGAPQGKKPCQSRSCDLRPATFLANGAIQKRTGPLAGLGWHEMTTRSDGANVACHLLFSQTASRQDAYYTDPDTRVARSAVLAYGTHVYWGPVYGF